FYGMYKEKLEDHSHFIKKVAETIPGAVYVFDIDQYKGIYSNNKLTDVIGYDHADLNSLGENAIPTLVHPDDQEILTRHLSELKDAKEKKPTILKYRVRKKDGSYKWLAHYESVFKRKEDGSVWQTIGITLDIDHEQKAVEELHQREQQLREAHDIAQLGHYYWDFANKNTSASSKTMELLEVKPNDFETFMEKVHPADRQKVKTETEKALKTGIYNCEYRIRGKGVTKVIWARGVVDYKSGQPVGMSGTVMDVTEHNLLIHKLAEADKRHKQAEALTHIGTYAWNFIRDEIEWSDEMYAIYEADKSIRPNFEFVLNAIHPDDRQTLETVIKQSIASQKPYDFYYRIITPTGKVRILHSRGGIELNEAGEPERVVGTDQDVTEKQTLIRALRKSESLYKQAEQIAAMGNWSWDIAQNKVEWTDQLYRIYGLLPQSEEITMERFLSFVHPDDRDYVSQGVEQLHTQTSMDYTFRIVTANGSEKWIRSIAQVLRNEAGEATSVIGSEQDVTEKQKLIGKLQESQRLYKQAQELARMGNFSWNIHTSEVFWSDEVYKIYEKPLGESVSFEDAFIPIIDKHKAAVQAAIEQTIATKKGQSISYAILTKDGGLKYINLHTDVGLNKDGTVSCIIGTAQDVTEKEELINRLQESEKLYKQAQSLAHMGNWTYDFTTGSITWSDELFAIYERPLGQVPTKEEWNNYLYPSDKEMLYREFEEVVEKRKPLDNTHFITLPNGKKKVLHRRGEVVYDQSGKAIKMIGTTQEITEQHRTQSELKESQVFIRKITDATPSIIASYNVNTGRYTFISEGIEKLLGYSPAEVMERGIEFFAGIIHPDDIGPLTEKNAAALEEANNSDKKDLVMEFTYRMKHSNGSYRWFHTYGTIFDYNAQGKVEHVLNISLDVSEQKQAIETIREQEYFIQQIADASPTILYLFDVPSQSIAYI
ncbi:MAG TPA: PAS domain-containing protein, partial [Flavisolibacter sp.]|nr:PAS domain-containing protein [Flavisolibacter sp.]